jgi:hypothetical protein
MVTRSPWLDVASLPNSRLGHSPLSSPAAHLPRRRGAPLKILLKSAWGQTIPPRLHSLANWGAKFGSPKIFVSLVEWADRIITE